MAEDTESVYNMLTCACAHASRTICYSSQYTFRGVNGTSVLPV